jgi:hypothetical protein
MKVGGASIKGDYFCPFCPTRCHKRGSPNIDKCSRCSRKGRDECFCCPIIHGEIIQFYCSDMSQIPPRKFDSIINFPKSDAKVDEIKSFLKVNNHII